MSVEPDGALRLCCFSQANRRVGSSIWDEVKALDDQRNAQILKDIRKDMLSGEPPEECERCSSVERKGGISQRLLAIRTCGEVKTSSIEAEPLQLIDLSLGNRCNLQCRMCNPYFSSGISKTYKALGITLDQKKIEAASNFNFRKSTLKDKEAWVHCKWLWLQGGEPLVSSQTVELLQQLIDWKLANQIELSIVSNLSLSIEPLLALLKQFKAVEITVSLDGTKKVAEYIRYPIQWEKFEANVRELLGKNYPNLKVSFLTTLQAYNFETLTEIFDWMKSLDSYCRCISRINLLEEPSLLAAYQLSPERKKLALERLMKWHDGNVQRFTPEDTENWSRLLEYSHLSISRGADQSIEFEVFTRLLDKMRNQSFGTAS